MAQDIVPIELGLTSGDLITLWAPRWREDGEEWEAFLGDDEDLFGFPTVSAMVAFIRTAADHDLTDHPAWSAVPQLSAADLVPQGDQRYDLVGVPELVAEDPDTWIIQELADIVEILRSLADVCELDKVDAVLDAAPGFGMLDGGTLTFTGREGTRLWDEISTVVAQRWDEVLDALDDLISTPDVDAEAVATAEAELAAAPAAAAPAADSVDSADSPGSAADSVDSPDAVESPDDDEPIGFWGEVGIDPVRIVSGIGEHYTLRCYVDDRPVFLGSDGSIDVFTSERALARFLAEDGDHDLRTVATWSEVSTAAIDGSLEVEVLDDNSYVLTGIADDLAEGPAAVDPVQLELAVELITDAEQWAGSSRADDAMVSSEPLGWLVSFVLRPDPTRLAPTPPFAAEVTAWRSLVDGFEDRLTVH